MRLVWLSIQSSYSHSSLALPLLANACAGVSGWEWERIDGVLGDDPFDVARQVVAKEPDLVCASLYLFNRDLTLDILKRVKRLKPDVRIAVGGPENLGDGAFELLKTVPCVDFACRGEGEPIMPILLERLKSGSDLRGVPGLLYRLVDGRIVDNGQSGLMMDWASSPMPCRHAFYEFGKPFVQLETSRGCPMGCTYCTSSRTNVRVRSLEQVRAELEHLKECGVKEIRLLDRTFNVPDSRGAALLRMFREEFGGMRFHLEIHPGVLGRGVRRELQKAPSGLLHIESGIQTLSHASLRAVGRSTDTDAALEGLAFLVGITSFETHCDLLTGLPEQTLDDVLSDAERLVEIGPGEVQMEVLKILPGTKLRNEAMQRGIIFSPEPPYDVMATPTMDTDDMRRCRHLSKILDRFHNAAPLRKTFRTMILEKEGALRRMLAWCEGREAETLSQPLALRRRFELMDEFLHEFECPKSLDELAIGWMTEAFPIGRGPGLRASLVHDIPAESVLIWGDAANIHHDGTRLWRLPLDGRTLFFAYNRAVAPNHAAAVFTS
ncbi:MAG: B12-binding domain-containing radical SAM protein [Lentisphaeria bacterium]|nr:B12-binding domain-containing radical SAM protein [Lentisphaeria bacterium]